MSGRSQTASVDLVLCTETLEHVLETRRFLAEAARCLVPGGTLLLTIPFAARWHFIPYDYWRFTPSSLNHLLTTTGFHSARVYARGNALTVACYKMMTLILLLLMPQTASKVFGLLLRLAGLVFLPLFILLAVSRICHCAAAEAMIALAIPYLRSAQAGMGT